MSRIINRDVTLCCCTLCSFFLLKLYFIFYSFRLNLHSINNQGFSKKIKNLNRKEFRSIIKKFLFVPVWIKNVNFMPPTPASPAQQVTIKLMIFNFIIPGVLWCVVSELRGVQNGPMGGQVSVQSDQSESR